MSLIRATSRITTVGLEEAESYLRSGKSAIWAAWHQDMVLGPIFFQERKIGMLVSPSRDGKIIGHLLKKLGFVPIYGSSRKGAKEAYQGMVRFVQSHKGQIMGITPDGPLGPKYVAKKGAVLAASQCGVPIFPIRFDAKRKIELNSWDQTTIPLPFNHIVICVGKPLHVPSSLSDEEVEAYRQALDRSLMSVVKRARELLNT